MTTDKITFIGGLLHGTEKFFRSPQPTLHFKAFDGKAQEEITHIYFLHKYTIMKSLKGITTLYYMSTDIEPWRYSLAIDEFLNKQ